MKKMLAVLLAAILAVGVCAGCEKVPETDENGNVIIATVNGRYILKDDYDEMYDYYYQMLIEYYGYGEEDAVSYLDSTKTEFVHDLIQQEVIRQEAEKRGYFQYTAEDRAKAEQAVAESKQEYINGLIEQYRSAFEGQTISGKKDGETDDEYFARLAEEKHEDYLRERGFTMEDMINEELENNAIIKFQEDLYKDVTVPESDVITAYNDQLAEQKQYIGDDPEMFASVWNDGTLFERILYYAEGFSLVQHILIPFDTDNTTEYVSLLQAFENTVDECDEILADCEIELEEAQTDEEKAEILDTIDMEKELREKALKDYNDTMAQAQAAVKEKVDEVYAAVKDADEAKFIEVMLKETGDTGMQTEEDAKKGYLVGPGDGMVESFSAAGQALNEGEISEPVASCYGMHILRCMKKLTPGSVPFDEVKADIEADIRYQKEDELWQSLLEEWEKNAKIKNFTDRY